MSALDLSALGPVFERIAGALERLAPHPRGAPPAPPWPPDRVPTSDPERFERLCGFAAAARDAHKRGSEKARADWFDLALLALSDLRARARLGLLEAPAGGRREASFPERCSCGRFVGQRWAGASSLRSRGPRALTCERCLRRDAEARAERALGG